MWSTINEIIHQCKQKLLRSTSSALTKNQSLTTKNENIMKVLNVAEKNDAAKNIASLLGRGHCNRVSYLLITFK